MTVPVPVSAAKAATETSKQRDNQNDDEDDTERRHDVSPLWNGTPSHAKAWSPNPPLSIVVRPRKMPLDGRLCTSVVRVFPCFWIPVVPRVGAIQPGNENSIAAYSSRSDTQPTVDDTI
jgi:hypothetical protein